MDELTNVSTETKVEGTEATVETSTETKTEAFKTFATEEDYNKAIKSEASKAKNELMKDIGIKNVQEGKDALTKSSTLETELNETKTKYQTLNEDFHLSKAGVKEEYREEVLTLAKARVSDELTFDKAVEAVVAKMPIVAGKPFQVKVGQERSTQEKNADVDKKLQGKYPWLNK